LPIFADYENLPYIQALIRETLRWNPIDPLDTYLMLKFQDDWYEGYFIPASTIYIDNMWDANVPEFKLEHYLDKQGRLVKAPVDTRDKGHIIFGFGRRICIERHLANNSLFINIAYML
ncbi:cytochrome P450 monooxygenase 89 like-protein, partial [Heterobasidion irregulare TC 32-1]